MLETITQLFLRDGHAPGDYDDEAWHRARIRWEWCSGQWVLIGEHNFLGWASWYRVTPETLALIRDGELQALTQGDPVRDLTSGPIVYAATVVVAPGAPWDTFEQLRQAVRARNADAETIAWHYRDRRDGTPRFRETPLAFAI